jgi:hypothetical protein
MNNPASRKLGISRDHNQFQYSYFPKNYTFGATQPIARNFFVRQIKAKSANYLKIHKNKEFL